MLRSVLPGGGPALHCRPRPVPRVRPSPPASRVLFRVFLADGRVLSSYGEWARLDDRVIFSMPTQLTRDPVELHLVTIPSQRVDWPRTEAVRRIGARRRLCRQPGRRGLRGVQHRSGESPERRREDRGSRAPDWRPRSARARSSPIGPASHYGYRIGEVRDALAVLDEVIAQLRVAMGITRFDLSLSANAPLAAPPPPPLPPPTDAELVEQFVAAASIADSPVERIGLLQTVMRLIDRAIGLLPAEWAARMRGTIGGDLDRERRVEQAYDDLRNAHARRSGRSSPPAAEMSDLERLREQRQGGGSPPRRPARRRRRGAARDHRSAGRRGRSRLAKRARNGSAARRSSAAIAARPTARSRCSAMRCRRSSRSRR